MNLLDDPTIQALFDQNQPLNRLQQAQLMDQQQKKADLLNPPVAVPAPVPEDVTAVRDIEDPNTPSPAGIGRNDYAHAPVPPYEASAPIYTPEAPGVVPPPVQPKTMTMADLIRTQKPVDDSAETQSRAKKAALMSGIGQVFGNLASAVAGRDSRTPRLAQDNNIEKLYAIAEQDKQKHDMLTRDWNARMGAATMQDQQIEMGNKRFEAQAKKDDAQAKQKAVQWAAEMGFKGQEAEQKAAQWLADHNQRGAIAQGNLKARYAAINKPDAATIKENQPVKIDTDLRSYTLTPQEAERLTSSVVGDPTITEDPKYSRLFTKVERMKNVEDPSWPGTFTKVGTGVFDYKVNPNADKHALARIALEQVEKKDAEEALAVKNRLRQGNLDKKPKLNQGYIDDRPTSTIQPDITEAEYKSLKKGDKFMYGGKELIKQ